MLFFGWVLRYLVIFILLAAVAVAGIFVGRALRIRKDKKNEQAAEQDE